MAGDGEPARSIRGSTSCGSTTGSIYLPRVCLDRAQVVVDCGGRDRLWEKGADAGGQASPPAPPHSKEKNTTRTWKTGFPEVLFLLCYSGCACGAAIPAAPIRTYRIASFIYKGFSYKRRKGLVQTQAHTRESLD